MENTLEPPDGSKYGDNPPQFLLDAMMEELGIGRINDLSLEDNPKERRNANIAIVPVLAKPPTKEIKKITNKYGNEINLWQSFKPDDVDQDALLLDDLGSGQSHRLRMQATLAGSSNRGGNDARGARGGHNGGNHTGGSYTGGSSRGGGLTGQSNRRNRAPIEEIANLLRYSDPLSVIRGGRGGGHIGNIGRSGVTHGRFAEGSNNSPQAKNASSGHAKQSAIAYKKSTPKRPPQQRPIQRNSSPILSLATPDSFFPNAKRIGNVQSQPTTGQTTIRQPVTGQPTSNPPVTGQTTTRQPAARQPATKPPPGTKPPAARQPATKPPVTKPSATEQPIVRPVAPIPKPSNPPQITLKLEVPKSNAPDNIRVVPSKHKDGDLIQLDLISLDDDSWVPTSTEIVREESTSGYMQDMWTLEENANAVFNMIVEVTRKGMAKEKQERVVLMESLASGVIPHGRGMSSSVYASDEPPVTKESINKYWETQGPSFRKGLENDSIRLILEGAAAEIVRRDAPTSSDLGEQDVSGNISESDQSNPEEVFQQTYPVVSGNVSEDDQPTPEDLSMQTNQADNLNAVTVEHHGVLELVEDICGSEEGVVDSKKSEISFLQYDVSELLQLRDKALAVDKNAFPDVIRPFVVKHNNELLQKPKVIKVLGGLGDSKWSSSRKSNNENAAPNTISAAPSKVPFDPSKSSFVPSKINVAPDKINAVPSHITRYDSTNNGAANFFSEKTQTTGAMSGLPASKLTDESKGSDTYTPLDFVSAISSASVPARTQRLGLKDSIWADSSPSKGPLARPSINKEVVDRVVNPQLTYSSKERRKKSIHIITEATKRRTAVLEKAAAEKAEKEGAPC
ncbi:hypothetical protein V493_03237 [Pseudogymnoascus sp. VKM F-4281 (FW-2241)]|nr:hypothetical protein V493_03237 [Pseudogymnoascus sp. VKM F-4281 (FW-2241)]